MADSESSLASGDVAGFSDCGAPEADVDSSAPVTDSGAACCMESSIDACVQAFKYSQSGFPEEVTSFVIGYDVKPASLIRSASSTKASTSVVGMSVTMFFSVAETRPGMLSARVCGFASSVTTRTMRCWRHMRLKSSEPSRERAYHRAW